MKRKKEFYDPYVELIDKFNRQGINYVVVGMSGINYYASNALETFSTQDFDIFVKPTIDNVKKSIAVFKELGYNVFSYSDKQQQGEDLSVKDVVKNKKTILAVDSSGITFELILSVSGFTFSQMEENATVFNVGNIPVKVSKLSKLLLAKKITGRKKDKLFLKRYEILLKERELNKTRRGLKRIKGDS